MQNNGYQGPSCREMSNDAACWLLRLDGVPKPRQEADKFFLTTAKGMNSRHGSWPYNSVRKELKDEMREFASERLQLVQVRTVCFSLRKVIVRSCPLNNDLILYCNLRR